MRLAPFGGRSFEDMASIQHQGDNCKRRTVPEQDVQKITHREKDSRLRDRLTVAWGGVVVRPMSARECRAPRVAPWLETRAGSRFPAPADRRTHLRIRRRGVRGIL